MHRSVGPDSIGFVVRSYVIAYDLTQNPMLIQPMPSILRLSKFIQDTAHQLVNYNYWQKNIFDRRMKKELNINKHPMKRSTHIYIHQQFECNAYQHISTHINKLSATHINTYQHISTSWAQRTRSNLYVDPASSSATKMTSCLVLTLVSLTNVWWAVMTSFDCSSLRVNLRPRRWWWSASSEILFGNCSLEKLYTNN